MIEFSIIGTDAELNVIGLALSGVLVDVVEGSQRYPGNDLRSRVYVRAAAVMPEFLPTPDPAPLASSPAGSSPAGDPPASATAPASAGPGPGLYPVPVFVDDRPTPRQRYNPELGRHGWWHPVEHWYVCLHCGVHKHKQPAGGGRWYDEWGYPEWQATEWGSNRGGGPFPRCPGPGQNVSSNA